MKNKLLKLRSDLMILLVKKTKPLYAKLLQKEKNGWDLSIPELDAYPGATLGKDLANFLNQEQFELMQGLESHDVYHVLLNYSTAVEEEALMQFFLIGNGKRSLYAIGTSLVAFLVMPDQWFKFWRAYRKGKHSPKIHLWDFRLLLNQKTKELQIMISKKTTGQEVFSTLKLPIQWQKQSIT